MTPHTPLIEALKDALRESYVDQLDDALNAGVKGNGGKWWPGGLSTAEWFARMAEIDYEPQFTEEELRERIPAIAQKMVDDLVSRIATETTEPDAAQPQSPKAIRAEAITDCVRVVSDFVARKNIDGLTQELITAIRSLGDRG